MAPATFPDASLKRSPTSATHLLVARADEISTNFNTLKTGMALKLVSWSTVPLQALLRSLSCLVLSLGFLQLPRSAVCFRCSGRCRLDAAELPVLSIVNQSGPLCTSS